MESKKRFALCMDNTGYDFSLVLHKIYEIIPDEQAERDDFIRLVDESGEDYLHHADHFVFLEFPNELEHAFISPGYYAPHQYDRTAVRFVPKNEVTTH